MDSLLAKAVQKEGKSESLIRCQTALKGAEMTDDSVTEVEVGILDAIFEDVCCVDVMYVVKIVRWMDGWMDGGGGVIYEGLCA
jgi:hypothetical protein